MLNFNCLECGNNFTVHDYRKETAKFCSHSCYAKNSIGKKTNATFNKCLICSNAVKSNPGRSHQFCSRKCAGIDRSKRMKGMIPHNKGVKYDYKPRPKAIKFGSKNPAWKGDKVGYFALHRYIERHLGKIKKCDFCGLNDPNRRYHWSNISGEYKRDFSDWQRLCAPCHTVFDIKNRPPRLHKRYPFNNSGFKPGYTPWNKGLKMSDKTIA